MKTRLQILGSLLIAAFILAEQLQFWPSQIVQRLEWIAYDQRVQQSQSHQADPGIVIVDIDEYSLQQVGQWPWPREYVAALIEILYLDYDIQLLGLDIVFAERQHNLWQQQLSEQHPELIEELNLVEGDDILGLTLAQFPVVVAHYFERHQHTASALAETKDETNARAAAPQHPPLPSTGLLTAPLQLENEQITNIQVPVATRYSANIEPIAENAIAGGFFDNPLTDSDGTFRRAAMLQEWQNELYPSLSLAMLYTLLGQMPATLDIQETGLEGIDMGGFYIPTDAHGGALVPFYGPRETFTYISAADIFNQQAPLEQLAGSIVLIGTSAPGLMDLRTTPVGAVYPGVEIHATLLAGMLAQEIKHEPVYSIAITAIILTLLALTMSLIFPRLSAFKLLLTGAALLALHLAINTWAWHNNLVLPLASGILLILTLSLYHLAANLWRENADKQRVAQTFGRYIPPKLVDDIVASPKAQDLQGREENLTVLFSDVRGFTSFAEQIPAAELSTIMNQLLTPVTEAIHNQRGTIDKYMGDAVMAFWGAPLPDQQQATHAIQAALDMQQAIVQFNQQYGHTLAMGIGIHTGTMNVGNMGSEYRMAYTVLGDNVNLGARIESLTKFYGVELMISIDTLQQLCHEQFSDSVQGDLSSNTASKEASNASTSNSGPAGNQHPIPLHQQQLIETVNASELNFKVRLLDIAIVKGKQEPVILLEVIEAKQLAQHQQTAADFINSSNQALQHYLTQNFQQALNAWQQHQAHYPTDQLAALYIERCQQAIQEPPAADWNGAFIHDSK